MASSAGIVDVVDFVRFIKFKLLLQDKFQWWGCGGATITLCDSCMYSYFYQTDAQFERCLDQLFSVQLSSVEAQVLLSKYGSNPQQRGMVCYRDFCAAIDAS